MQSGKKGDVPRHIGRTKNGLNSKLHAVINEAGKPLILALTAGQVSDHLGAKIVYPALPKATTLIADKGYESDDYRDALKAKGIAPCIAPRKGRIALTPFCKTQYKQRHKVENMFGCLKDWRRIATRYNRCADIFMAASPRWVRALGGGSRALIQPIFSGKSTSKTTSVEYVFKTG